MTPAKRRILTVGAGAVVITALEGIACGNPVAPRCKSPSCYHVDPPEQTTPADAGVSIDSALPPGVLRAPAKPGLAIDAGPTEDAATQ